MFPLHISPCFKGWGWRSIGLCSFGSITHWGSDRNTAFDECFAFPLVENLECQITAALPRVLWHGPAYVIWICVCGVATFLIDQINATLSGRSKCGDWSCTINHLRAWCPAAEREAADKSCCCRLREVCNDEDDKDSSKWNHCNSDWALKKHVLHSPYMLKLEYNTCLYISYIGHFMGGSCKISSMLTAPLHVFILHV